MPTQPARISKTSWRCRLLKSSFGADYELPRERCALWQAITFVLCTWVALAAVALFGIGMIVVAARAATLSGTLQFVRDTAIAFPITLVIFRLVDRARSRHLTDRIRVMLRERFCRPVEYI